jgi:hypothetical protein
MVRARFKELFAEENLRKAACPSCGKWQLIAPDAPVTGTPAHACSCGAVYCAGCYEDRLPGHFGEELKSLPMYFIPMAAVGYYIAAYNATLEYTGLVLGASVLGGVIINQQVYLPLSRLLGLAKKCGMCGGRTFADWRAVSVVEPGEDSESVHGSESGPSTVRRARLLDELGPT